MVNLLEVEVMVEEREVATEQVAAADVEDDSQITAMSYSDRAGTGTVRTPGMGRVVIVGR